MERSARSADALIDELASADHVVGAEMSQLDRTLSSAMPGRARTLWEGVFWGGTEQSIIGYGEIVQPRPRGSDVEWFLIGLARQKRHFSVYVNAVEDGAYLGARYADRLGKVKAGSASITFNRIDDVDLDVLAELAARAHTITPPDHTA